MLGIGRQPRLSNFDKGYREAASLIGSSPYFRLHGGVVLQQLGIHPPETISDRYDIWNPAADRTTAVRFGGDDHAFYQFADGATAAVQELIDAKRGRI